MVYVCSLSVDGGMTIVTSGAKVTGGLTIESGMAKIDDGTSIYAYIYLS